MTGINKNILIGGTLIILVMGSQLMLASSSALGMSLDGNALIPTDGRMIAAIINTSDITPARTKLVDQIIKLQVTFDKISDKIRQAQNFDDSVKTQLLALNQDCIQNLQTLTAKAQKSKTREELINVALMTHQQITDTQLQMKQAIGNQLKTRIEDFEAREKSFVKTIENRFSKIKQAGNHPPIFEQQFQDCHQNLSGGNELLQQARAKFIQLQGMPRENIGAPVHDAMESMRQARLKLNDAQQACHKLVIEMRVRTR